MVNALIIFFSLSISAISIAQDIDQSIIELIETGVKVGNINGCGDAGFSEDELIDANHEITYAEAELRELLDKVKECAKWNRLTQLKISDQCKDEKAAADDKFFALKNFDDKKKVSLGCKTRNDNSPLFYLTKNEKHRGTDEGATATHQCFLEYPTPNGRVIMRLENALFTEFVDVWLGEEDRDNDGDFDTEVGQRALERSKLEIMYQWVEKPGLKIAIGPYISRQVRGESNATDLQTNWHVKNGVRVYHEVTPEDERVKKLGGGITLEVEKTLLEKYKPHYELNSKAYSKTDFGYEAGSVLLDQKLGANFMGRAYTSSRNTGGYFGAGAGLEFDNTTFGGESNTAIWRSMNLEAGYKFGNKAKLGVFASHGSNMNYSGPIASNKEERSNLYINDDGQDRITTKSKENFLLGVKARFRLDGSTSTKERKRIIEMQKNHLEISIEVLEQEIDKIVKNPSANNSSLDNKMKKLKKLNRELAEIKYGSN